MTQDQSRRAGLLFGLGAYLIWGVLPLYFKLLAGVSATEIVAHRIVWSLVFLAALATLWRRWPTIRAAVTTPRVMMTLAVTALLIAINWLIYIWAVINGHVLEGSLGYYLNPLVNVLLGVVILKERLTRGQLLAVLLAGLGVSVLAVQAASGLWISLALALSFGLYGFIRKIAPADALEGLAIETAVLAPLSIGWILWLQHQGTGGFAAFGATTNALLILGGALTAIPLLLFNGAAKRLPYSTLGFLQYIAPSLQFLLAVLAFGEPFTRAHALCFAAIWTALAIFAVEGFRIGRARARAVAECLEPCP
ncbi:MAG TPA: EamA family transporter RarD [Allosphingosinicella sp.]|nr:EamA family transporter RarD [Allosphingosinicella sp.]